MTKNKKSRTSINLKRIHKSHFLSFANTGNKNENQSPQIELLGQSAEPHSPNAPKMLQEGLSNTSRRMANYPEIKHCMLHLPQSSSVFSI